jgi:hypothetical protein
MEDVLGVIEQAFSAMSISVESVLKGPPTWVWEDLEMRAIGFPKFYILGESTEYPGYPLLTIRQAYSSRFDTWITMSGLVVGPDASGITRSVAMAMAHHSGAFAGVRWAARAISENQNVPIAGMVAVKMLMEADPPRITLEQAEELVEEAQEAHSGKVMN